jgi:glucose/arabinose dehydrogenase
LSPGVIIRARAAGGRLASTAWLAQLAVSMVALPGMAGEATLRLDAAPPASPRAGISLRLEVVAQGLDRPLDLVSPPGDARLFVVEQGGEVRVIRDGHLLPVPFLDLRAKVRAGGERGLLSLAFHPRYAANGLCYVNYTDREGDTRVERYRVSSDPDRADPGSGHLVVHIAQPHANHNGGLVCFGPDGMLYIGMGDGGSQRDPHRNGQNPGVLLGKLLRIDVDHGDPYAIPPDNPFVGRPGFRPEIWALGLRNPWRFCFDPPSGQLIIADVGQNQWEEIDAVPYQRGGWNFGWSLAEGRHPMNAGTPSVTPLTGPVWEYDHERGCSIIGGFVYRGRAIPGLGGLYLYSDYCDGRLFAVRIEHGQAAEPRGWDLGTRGAVSSFGEDARGEVYLTTFDGRVSRIVPAP